MMLRVPEIQLSLCSQLLHQTKLSKIMWLANIARLSIQHLGTVSVSKSDLNNAIKKLKLIKNLEKLKLIVENLQLELKP